MEMSPVHCSRSIMVYGLINRSYGYREKGERPYAQPGQSMQEKHQMRRSFRIWAERTKEDQIITAIYWMDEPTSGKHKFRVEMVQIVTEGEQVYISNQSMRETPWNKHTVRDGKKLATICQNPWCGGKLSYRVRCMILGHTCSHP